MNKIFEEKLVNIDLDIGKLIDSAPVMNDLAYIYIRVYGGDDIDPERTGFIDIKGTTELQLAAIEMMIEHNPQLKEYIKDAVNEIIIKTQN